MIGLNLYLGVEGGGGRDCDSMYLYLLIDHQVDPKTVHSMLQLVVVKGYQIQQGDSPPAAPNLVSSIPYIPCLAYVYAIKCR